VFPDTNQQSLAIIAVSSQVAEGVADIENGFSTWSTWSTGLATAFVGLILLVAVGKFALTKL
jgi:hypothetical protein